MNGTLEIILGYVDTGAVIVVLIWVVGRLQSGQLISRSMHDEILEVYQKEAAKLTNGMDRALKDLMDVQKEAVEQSEESREEMRKITKQIVEGMTAIEKAVERG